jgi:hypothetical protein
MFARLRALQAQRGENRLCAEASRIRNRLWYQLAMARVSFSS